MDCGCLKQGAEDKIWTKEGWSDRMLEKTLLQGGSLYSSPDILGSSYEIGRKCSTHEKG
jgi:hypothetical protein